jgi:hypothetical protein
MEKEKYTSPCEDFTIVEFGDKRLTKRLVKSTEERMKGLKTRSSAKGFYRLLSNEKFSHSKMELSCRKGTVERMRSESKVLLVQDSTDINLNGHKKTEGLGYCSRLVKGIQAHSCLALSATGLPLGLMSQSYETRLESKSSLSIHEKKSRPMEEKESYRWVKTLKETVESVPAGVEAIVLCDREGDIYEVYRSALEIGCDFVIRVAQDRKTETSDKIFSRVRKSPPIGYATVEIPRDSGKNRKARVAKMAVSSCSVRISKSKHSLPLNLVRIVEISETDEPVEWILSTSLPVETAEDAMQIVQYYVQRWKIERFHYVLKQGCKVEEIQQRSVERILPVILICSMIANFILAMTYFSRISPDASCDLMFDEDEWKLLYRFAKKTKTPPEQPYSLAEAISFLGQFGVGKRAPSDGDYGVKAIWLGLKAFYSALHLFVGQV